MKFASLVLVVVTATAALAADTAEKVPLTFSAVLTMGKEKRFGIANSTGNRSEWLVLGSEFEGYKLSEYDDAAQTLVLQHEGKTYRLPIASGRVQTLTSKATLTDASEVVNKMKIEEMLTHIIDQQKQAVTAMSKQMLGQMGGRVSPEDFAAFQEKVVDAMWAEMQPDDLKKDFTKMYADVFTKEELHAMSDFYSTPAGAALVDKQQLLQQKMMEVMMPRMKNAMPRVQQMAKDFAQEQSAKAKNLPAASGSTAAPAKAQATSGAPAPAAASASKP